MFNPVPSMTLALSFFETSVAAAAIVQARMPILFSAAFTGSPQAVQASQQMIAEKANVAMEGTLAASMAVFELWFHAACTLSAPDMTAWSKVAEAAFAPARRTVEANARRLT